MAGVERRTGTDQSPARAAPSSRRSGPDLDALVDVGSRTLAWRDAAAATVDVAGFEAAADRGLAGRSRCTAGSRRVSTRAICCPTCAGEWIEADRERLRQRASRCCRGWSACSKQDRAFGDAIEHAQQLLRLDPLDEQAWCALMRCHARRGERATALHLYQQCAALLKKELGVQPSAATRITYREILDLDAEAPVVPAPPRTSRVSARGPPIGMARAAQRLARSRGRAGRGCA